MNIVYMCDVMMHDIDIPSVHILHVVVLLDDIDIPNSTHRA